MNLYADLGHFRRAFLNASAPDTVDQTGILRILKSASRAVDGYCDRHFYVVDATRYLDGNGGDLLFVPDLVSISTLKLDEDTDGTYEVTLTINSDYWAIHYGARDQDSLPYTALKLNRWQGSRSNFLDLPRLVEIVGSWGYTADVDRVTGSTVQDDPLAADATELNVTAGTGDELYEEGQTLLLGSEQVHLTGIDNDALTIERGINGTTAASHDQDTLIDRYCYIPEVVEATLIQAGRLWKRRETAYSTIIQEPAIGTIEVYKGLDPDVRMLLNPFRKVSV